LTLESLSLINCVSDDSLAPTPPPANGGGGAGILAIDSSSLSLVLVTFASHTSSYRPDPTNNGDGKASGGGGAIMMIDSSATIESCLFENNSGGRGGALYFGGRSKAVVNNTDFVSNTVVDGDGGGGAVYCGNSSQFTMSYSRLRSNSAEGFEGGAVLIAGQSRFWSEHNIYRNNTASYGAGVSFHDESVSSSQFDVYVKNHAANNGGGAYIVGSATVTLNSTKFNENVAAGVTNLLIRGGSTIVIEWSIFEGAGVFKSQESQMGIIAGDVTVRNTVFKNSFPVFGGGVKVEDATQSFLMEDCLFINNTAFDDGALHFSGLNLSNSTKRTDFVVRRTRFENNRAISSGGVLGAVGINKNFVVRFEHCEFVNNSANAIGGVGYFEGDGLYFFEDCTFGSNSASTGGVFGVTGSALVRVTRSTFVSNAADNGGTLFATKKGSYHVTSSTFNQNFAKKNGGVYYSDFLSTQCPKFVSANLLDNSAVLSGGAFYFDLIYGEKKLSHCLREAGICKDCSFSNNRAEEGYGPNYATSPQTMVLSDKRTSSLYPSQTFVSHIVVLDGFDQTLRGFVG